jgi:hypothetical protein
MKYSATLVLLLVLLTIVATHAQGWYGPYEEGLCHSLVAKGPHGISRTVILDALSAMTQDFGVVTKDHSQYSFRVCSNMMCGGWPVWETATCAYPFKSDNQYPLSGTYPLGQTPVATLSLDYQFGAIQFNMTQFCSGRTCRYSTITVVCDPTAKYVTQGSNFSLVWFCFYFHFQSNANTTMLVEQTSRSCLRHPPRSESNISLPLPVLSQSCLCMWPRFQLGSEADTSGPSHGSFATPTRRE